MRGLFERAGKGILCDGRESGAAAGYYYLQTAGEVWCPSGVGVLQKNFWGGQIALGMQISRKTEGRFPG